MTGWGRKQPEEEKQAMGAVLFGEGEHGEQDLA